MYSYNSGNVISNNDIQSTGNSDNYTCNIHIYPNIWIMGGESNVVFNRGIAHADIELPDDAVATNDEISLNSNSISISANMLQDIFMNTKQMTISYWKKNLSNPSTSHYDLIMTNSSHIYFKVFSTPYSSNRLYCQLGNGNGHVQSLNVVLNNMTNDFNHFAFTLKDNTLKAFVNNAQVGVIVINSTYVPPSSSAYFRIGGNHSATFKDIRIWDRDVVDTSPLYRVSSSLLHYSFTNTSPAYLSGTVSEYDAYMLDEPVKSIQFNSNSFISIPTNIKSQYNIANGITLSYWKYHTLPVSTQSHELETNNYINIKTGEVTIFNNKTSIPIEFEQNRWYHVTVTAMYINNTVDLSVYIDGAKVACSYMTDTTIVEPSSISYMRFGQNGLRVQEFELFKTALTETEVYSHHIKWLIYSKTSYSNHREKHDFTGSINNFKDITPLSITHPGDQTGILLWYKYKTASPVNDGSHAGMNGSSSGVSIISSGLNNTTAAQNGSTTVTDSGGTLMSATQDLFSISFWSKGNIQFSGLKTSINISSNNVSFSVDSNDNQSMEVTTPFNDIGNWHHYTFTYTNTSTLTIYIDGLFKNNKTNNTFNRASSTQTGISINMTFIQDFRIYNYALEPFNITCAMESVNGYEIDDLEVMYRFHDKTNINNLGQTSSFNFIANSGTNIVSGHACMKALQLGTTLESNDNTIVSQFLQKLQTGFTVLWWNKGQSYFEITTAIKAEITSSNVTLTVGNVSISTTLPDNNYHHWCFKYDTSYNTELGTYLAIYMDGYKIVDTLSTENIVALADYNTNLSFKLNGTNNVLIEDFRIYSKAISFIDIQEVFYEFPEYKDHANDLMIWYRFADNNNIANENDDYKAVNDITPTYQDGQYHLSFNSGKTVSIHDNTHTSITYTFTSPLDQFLEPIIFTMGRTHVLKWPSSSEQIKISASSIWGEELDVVWIEYDTNNNETRVQLPWIYYDNDNLYWYSSTNQTLGNSMISILEPETSIFSALKNMSTNDFTVSYWARNGSKLAIKREEDTLLHIETSPVTSSFRVGMSDGTLVGVESVSVTTDNAWHNWCFTYSHTTTSNIAVMETYKDGNILNQDTVTGFDNFLTVVSTDILTWDLGKDGTSIRDFRIYLRPLDNVQINNLTQYQSFDVLNGLQVMNGGYNNPFSLSFNTKGQQTYIDIPNDFLNLTKQHFQSSFDFWLYPTNNNIEIELNIANSLILSLTKTAVFINMASMHASDSNINMILNRWYNVKMEITHFTSYLEISISIKDNNNIEITKNPVSRFYIPFVITADGSSSFTKIVGCLLDTFKITGALDNLLLQYPFDNIDNSVVQSSTGKYNGSITSGTPTLSSTYITNISSLDTTVNTTQILVGEQLGLRFNVVEMTISFWKNDLDIYRDGNDFRCSYQDNDIIKIVAPNNQRGVDFIVGDNTTTVKASTDTNTILPNRWYFYTFVLSFNGLETTLKVYVDAVLSATYTSADFIPFKNITAPDSVVLGQNISPAYIEDFKIYNRVLSADDIYRQYYVNSILSSTDATVLLRFDDLTDGNIKNYGTHGDNITPVIYDNTNKIITKKPSSYYNGNEYNVYKKNNWALSWSAPTGNQFLGFNADTLIQDFESTGRISIMFKQKTGRVKSNVSYNTFSITDGQTVYVDVKTPSLNNKVTFNIKGYNYDVNVNSNELNNMWVSWVFTAKINGRYLYVKIFKDGYCVGRKTHDTGSTLSLAGVAGTSGKIGPFNDTVLLEDFRIYNKLLTYADIPQSLGPKKVSNDISIADITRNELEYNLDDMFSGTNITYSIESNPLINARIDDGKIAKIFGNYRGQTYDIVWKASNNNGHALWTTTVTEVNAPPITFVSPDANATITITSAFSLVGAEGTEQYNEFVVQVEEEIAEAIGVDPEFVEVTEITAGSIIIDFIVKSNPKKPDVVPAVLLKDLNEQKGNSNSKFKKSKLIGTADLDVPEQVLKQAENPDTIYFTVETDQPEVFDISNYFRGLSVDFKVQQDPYDNVVVDAKKQTVTITGNFRDTTYEAQVKASNPSSVKILKFEITELALTAPTAKPNGKITIGEEEEIIDLTDKFIGSRLTIFEIEDDPYSNVVPVAEGELDTEDEENVPVFGKYKISGAYRNALYQVKFKATQDVSNNPQSAVWIADVLELPSPPVKEVPDMSVSLTAGQEVEYDLSSVISGSNVQYKFLENRYLSIIDDNNILKLVESSRGVKYNIEIEGANNGGYRRWILSVTETEPPAPVRLIDNQSIRLSINSYNKSVADILSGVNIEYNVAQFDKGSGYLNTTEHDVFTQNPPWARYHAQNWNYDNLADSSGNSRDSIITTSGIVREIVDTGNGSSVPINYLFGTKTDSLKIPMPNTSSWTVCALVRYSGQNKGKILSADNIILGHWSGNRGIVQIGSNFLTNPVNVGTTDNWLVICAKTGGAVNGNVLIDGVESGTDVGSTTTDYLYVNRAFDTDFALADIMIWDTQLSDNDMKTVSSVFLSSLNNTGVIVRDNIRSLNKLSLYNNVDINTNLNVAGNYRGITYDVYLTAENIKATTAWTLTVTEMVPPSPNAHGDKSSTVSTGLYSFPLTAFIDGYNIEYTIQHNQPNNVVYVSNNTLFINASYRNISYSVDITATNKGGSKSVSFSVTETGPVPPRLKSDDTFFYVNSGNTNTFNDVFDNVSSVSVKQSPFNNVTVNGNSINIIGANRNRYYPVVLTATNQHGSIDITLHVIESGRYDEVLQNLNVPSTHVYMEHSTTIVNLTELGISSEYTIKYNPYEHDDNVDIVNNMLFIDDDHRGTYDVIVATSNNRVLVVRIHEREKKNKDIDSYLLMNCLFNVDKPDTGKYIPNYTHNITKIKMLERTVPPIAKGDINVLLTNKPVEFKIDDLIRGYILKQTFIQDNLFNNASIVDDKLVIVPNDRDEEYDVILRAENDYGVSTTNIRVDERNVKNVEDNLKVWYSFDGTKSFNNYS